MFCYRTRSTLPSVRRTRTAADCTEHGESGWRTHPRSACGGAGCSQPRATRRPPRAGRRIRAPRTACGPTHTQPWCELWARLTAQRRFAMVPTPGKLRQRPPDPPEAQRARERGHLARRNRSSADVSVSPRRSVSTSRSCGGADDTCQRSELQLARSRLARRSTPVHRTGERVAAPCLVLANQTRDLVQSTGLLRVKRPPASGGRPVFASRGL